MLATPPIMTITTIISTRVRARIRRPSDTCPPVTDMTILTLLSSVSRMSALARLQCHGAALQSSPDIIVVYARILQVRIGR